LKRTYTNAFAATLFLGIAAMIGHGCGKGAAAGGNLAVVNGEAISLDEYHSYLERKSSVQVITQMGPQEARVFGSLGLQGLRDLINRRIVLQIAKDEQVMPTDKEINEELDFQTKRRPSFVKTLTASGMTLDQIRADLALDLAQEKILTKGITVTPDEVSKFIKENPKKFATPEQAQLLWIVVKGADKKSQVDADLGAGQPFGVVAGRYSEAPNARQSGGMYNESVVEKFPPRLRGIIAKTDELKTTDWLADGANFVKFYVQKKVKEKPVLIDDTLKEAVRRDLAKQRGSQANDLAKRMQDKLKTAKIDVQVPQLKDAWDRAFDALLKEQVSPSTSTAPAVTPPTKTVPSAATGTPPK